MSISCHENVLAVLDELDKFESQDAEIRNVSNTGNWIVQENEKSLVVERIYGFTGDEDITGILPILSERIDECSSVRHGTEPLIYPCIFPFSKDMLNLDASTEDKIDQTFLSTTNAFNNLSNSSEKIWSRGETKEFTRFRISNPRHNFSPIKRGFISSPCKLAYEAISLAMETNNSILRKPGKLQDYSRVKADNVPFLAGGKSLGEAEIDSQFRRTDSTIVHNIKDETSLLALQDNEGTTDKFIITPPGLSSSLKKCDVAKNTISNPLQRREEEKNVVGRNPEGILSFYEYDDKVHSEKDKYQIKDTDNTPGKGLITIDDDISYLLLSENPTAKQDTIESTPNNTKVEEKDLVNSFNILSTGLNVTGASSTRDIEDTLQKILQPIIDIRSSQTVSTSEWAITQPIDTNQFHENIPNMAMKYPFELDNFQKQAIMHIENQDSVFVAAHTSAGKTVVAEYAIALAKQHKTRAIYTSPIKALSNQKFRDFRCKFGSDVGIITGDVSIDPDASCLVMTTEILRSMLYRGADLIRDIEWVIFDEIHYINDSDRGVVWEEVIIMLPDHVNMVFLSATTPNTYEFSDWIGRTKRKKVFVISTTTRPIPLEHYLYSSGELFKIMDNQGSFIQAGYSSAKVISEKKEKEKANSSSNRGRGGKQSNFSKSSSDKGQWIKLIRTLEEKGLLPVVIFAFSKRLCEESANRLTNVDLTSSRDKSEIHVFLESSLTRLQGTDAMLPQVLSIKEMLMRGFGIHHGGLLPIIKEMVEILFSRGLVKVLFATETFAMGVNMPARTVVFNGLRKHDGREFRDLLPGEYIQMAGRAGRRGLDNIGTVIVGCFSSFPEITTIKSILIGKATKLKSQFRLTYNMILNLFRVEDMTVEDMMKRSFSEFHTRKALEAKLIPSKIREAKKLLKNLEEQKESCIKGGEVAIEDYYILKEEEHFASNFIHNAMIQSRYVSLALCVGRIVLLYGRGLHQQKCMVLKTVIDRKDSRLSNTLSFVALVLCPADYEAPISLRQDPKSDGNMIADRFFLGEKSFSKSKKPITYGDVKRHLGVTYVFLNLPVEYIGLICKAKYNQDAASIINGSEKELLSGIEYLISFSQKYASPKIPPALDPRLDLKMNDIDFMDAYQGLKSLQDSLSASKCHECPQQAVMFDRIDRISRIRKYIDNARYAASNDNLSLFPDYKQRTQVLIKLGYINKDHTVQLKGRVACEINTCEELILTEIIFENLLDHLEPEEIVSVLSSLIFQEKRSFQQEDDPYLTPRLSQAKEKVIAIGEALTSVQRLCHLNIDPEDYMGVLNFGLMEVVYEWARGMPFLDICKLTTVPEGSIVRCITRLDEVCREVRNVSRMIGDAKLFQKMEIASQCIKRDVVFASSLYLP